MRRFRSRRSIARTIDFRPLLEVAEPRILLSITARSPAAIVNTSTAGTQISPAVAMDANGDSIVVWKDASQEVSPNYESDIRAQRYSPTGSTVHQNGTTAGAQEFVVHSEADAKNIERGQPAVAMDPSGDFVVAWLRDDGTNYPNDLLEIQARVFNSVGAPLTADINVSANDVKNRNQPTVAMDSSGNWIIAWSDPMSGANATNDIYAKKYSLNGTQLMLNNSTNPLLVNTGTAVTGNQFEPSVATDSAGNFVVSWTSFDPNNTGPGQEAFAQRFNASGVAQGSLIHVNTVTTQSQGNSKVAMTPAGDFIITWFNDLNDSSTTRGDIDYKRYNADGTLRNNAGNADLQANLTTLDNQQIPSVGIDANGNATISWNTVSHVDSSNLGVFIRRINAQGQPIESSDIQVGTLTGTVQDQTHVAVDSQGDVAVAYHQTVSNNQNIFAQFFKYINDAPTLTQPGNLTINQNAPQQTVNLAGIAAGGPAGASNPESQTLSVTASSDTQGLIPDPTVNYTSPGATGTLTFTPVSGQSGTATITVTLSDNGGNANGGVNQIVKTFTVTVTHANRAPTLDPIADRGPLPVNAGQQTVNLTGITAGLGDSGQTITITASSDTPSVVPTPNVIYTSPNATGTLTFTPVNNAFGTATITVTATDNGGTLNGGVNQLVRTFTITVVGPPTANAQSVSVSHDTFRAITLTGSDPNSPPRSLTYAIVANPAHGTLSGFNAATGSVTYTPTAGYQGADSFTFKDNNGVSDSNTATVTLTVAAATPTANSQSVGVAHNTATAVTLTGTDGNDSPALPLTYSHGIAAHGTITGSGSNLTYTPNTGYHGSDSFTFTTSNGQNTSATATVTLAVAVGTPTANAQTVSTNSGTPLPITLTASDDDIPALSLTFVVTVQPTHGTLNGTAPNLTYNPSAGYSGPDSFQFQASNGTNTSASATISITVNAVNHAPTANAQSVSTNQDTALNVTLTASDADLGDTLTYTVTAMPTHGGLSGTAPNLTYTPTAGYHGPDSFQFKVNDGHQDSSVATVSITVNPPSGQGPSVTGNPADQAVFVGQTATFTASASGTPTPTVQWQVSTDGGAHFGDIPGATSTSLSFTANFSQNGSKYQAVFTNPSGQATTTAATLTVQKVNITGTSVLFGTSGSAALVTAGDGLRLLPTARNNDLPWLNINRIQITLNQGATLTPADVTVTGLTVANYGSVTISNSGTTYTITLAQSIGVADRVTVTIGNAAIATYTRRLDVLPGDVNDDAAVDAKDSGAIRNVILGLAAANPFDDIDGNGIVDMTDYNLARARGGTKLP